jgi:hypothetical protein
VGDGEGMPFGVGREHDSTDPARTDLRASVRQRR